MTTFTINWLDAHGNVFDQQKIERDNVAAAKQDVASRMRTGQSKSARRAHGYFLLDPDTTPTPPKPPSLIRRRFLVEIEGDFSALTHPSDVAMAIDATFSDAETGWDVGNLSDFAEGNGCTVHEVVMPKDYESYPVRQPDTQ